MGKFNPTKFRVKHGHGGVLGEARFIAKQGSGKNNAATRGIIAAPDGGFMGSAASIPNPFVANAVNFDGSNDFLTRDTALSNAEDATEGTVSFWINKADDGSIMHLYDSNLGSGQLDFFLTAAGNVEFFSVDAAGADVWLARSTEQIVIADGWTHVILSFNTVTGERFFYIADDPTDLVFDLFGPDRVAVYDGAMERSIGSTFAEDTKLDGDLAELFISNKFIDLSVEANRRKFITADGLPVDLNNTGLKPQGVAPMVYMTGVTDNWHLNASGNGAFVESGALTTAATSPSD